ncbi:MAG TPA: prepilin peptidase [Magnetospirillum sp.]|jgi:prepilin peptidase CpaA|nr:prepilin peptidase [Magnetospirillum sp.]
MIHSPALWTVFGLLLYAVWTDIAKFRIANAVPLGIVLLFPVHALSTGMSLHDAALHGLAGCAVLTVTFLLYTAGLRFGGGDAKLLSAVALWAGFSDLALLLLNLSLVGGALALAVVMASQMGVSGWAVAHGWRLPIFEQINGKHYIPYAVPIAVGFAFTVL